VFQAAQFGFLYGAGLSLMLGTVFFALIRHGMYHGFKAGFAIASGVILSDLLFIVLAFWFTDLASQFIRTNQFWITILGGVFIFLMGLVGLLIGIKKKPRKTVSKPFNFAQLLVLGFTLNIMNPVNFFAWLTIQSILLSKQYTQAMSLTFLVFSLIAIGLVEIAIAVTANQLGSRLKDQWLKRIHVLVQILFLLIGSYLIVSTVFS